MKKRLEIHNPVRSRSYIQEQEGKERDHKEKPLKEKKNHRRKKHAIFPAHYPKVINHMTFRTKNFLFPPHTPFLQALNLVDLLNLWAVIATGRGRTASAGEAASTGHATRSTALTLVKLHHDGVGDTL